MRPFIKLCILVIFASNLHSQHKYTLADTLRGSLRPARTCYDVTFYHLDILVDIQKQRISGSNDIHFLVTEQTSEMQIDLYENMDIQSIQLDTVALNYRRIANAVFIETPLFTPGEKGVLKIFYEGSPRVAQNPPWDGGFVWEKDSNGHPWVGVACEGAGASLWWPNKDHLSDEPDSMRIDVTIPNELVCVSNGALRSIQELDNNLRKFSWHVQYPINNYNVSINVADYVHFSDTYYAQDGDSLDLDYYVLRENLEKAKKHFKQTPGVLEAFEYYFGKFPFWNDGFCLVETPYLGMEHQSAIAYGNGYQRGYLGSMIPRDMHFDYVIVHETGHEYWGNCISVGDHAEMWIHESFTTYMESLYVEYHLGKEAAERYLKYQRPFIMNRAPIMGPFGVNFQGFVGSDHYYKGAWVLHTLRNTLNNDGEWFRLLRKLYSENACSITNTEEIIQFFNRETKRDFRAFFQQYLFESKQPVLKYQLRTKGKKQVIIFKWDDAVIDGFTLPIKLSENGQSDITIYPTKEVQTKILPFNSTRDVEILTQKGYFKAKPFAFK